MNKSVMQLSYIAALQAVVAAIIACNVALKLFALGNPPIGQVTNLVIIGGLALVTLIFYLTVHLALKADTRIWSTYALLLLNAANIAYLISVTGSIDSPYYALWIGLLVVVGLVSPLANAVLLIASFIGHGFVFSTATDPSSAIGAHMGQLGITVGAAALSEWLRRGLGAAGHYQGQVEALHGQLEGETIKSETIMDHVSEGIIVVDAKRRIQLFNRAAIEMTGWDGKSADNIDYRLVLGLQNTQGEKLSDDNDPFNKAWQTKKNLVSDDLVMQTKGGHRINVMLSISPVFGADGKPDGGICLFRDVTGDKEVERLRDEFISTASHEMRTPVAAIEGYLALAMNPSVATIDDRAKGYLDKAHNATTHLGELFRDLLSITKIDNSGAEDKREPVELSKLLKEAVSDMQFSAKAKGLELQFMPVASGKGEKSITPLFAVSVNQQRIREVVMNLIENAIKFTPQGRVSVSIHGDKEQVTVEVSDSGIGIAPEDASHLFQKFYRIDNSATRTIGGTGLGLYLCRTIIEGNGGRIWVDSKMGHGSTFSFTLPRIENDKLSQPEAAAIAAAADIAKS